MSRFFRRGESAIVFETASATPTLAQINAGTQLTTAIANITGWDFANTPISTPDLSTTFDTQIGGPDTVGSPTIEFYDDDAAATIRTALAKGNSGWIIRCPYGKTSGLRSEVFPVKSTALNDSYTLGNEAAKFVVGFAITAAPNLAYSIP